jgi:hypothetical protein
VPEQLDIPMQNNDIGPCTKHSSRMDQEPKTIKLLVGNSDQNLYGFG